MSDKDSDPVTVNQSFKNIYCERKERNIMVEDIEFRSGEGNVRHEKLEYIYKQWEQLASIFQANLSDKSELTGALRHLRE